MFTGADRVGIESFEVPEPGVGQVLVRVHRSQVSVGRSMGNDGGRVLATGSGVDDFKPGDRVLAFGNHGSHWLTGQAWRAELAASVQPVEYEYDIPDEQADFSVLGDVSKEDAFEAVRELTDGAPGVFFMRPATPRSWCPA